MELPGHKEKSHGSVSARVIIWIKLQWMRLQQKSKIYSRMQWMFMLTISFIILLYIHLLYVYGTLSPPAVWYYTTPYHGLTSSDYPPNGWKPPFRVVVSLTTTPNRLTKVGNAIESLLTQSIHADAIYLSIPTGPMKRHPERSYDEVGIPIDLLDEKNITVLRSLDYGPATKLIPALQHEMDPTTLVITVDDDFIYPHRLLEALAWEAYHNPEEAIGVCGWGTMPVLGHIGFVPVYVPYVMRPLGRYVDILQACCGNAYRRKFFKDLSLLADMPPICITVDDVWIAGYLAIQSEVKRAIISKRLDPDDPEWKVEESRSKEASLLKLSGYNDANHVHAKCVAALEEKLDHVWTRVRNY